jgi:hypothetical protein
MRVALLLAGLAAASASTPPYCTLRDSAAPLPCEQGVLRAIVPDAAVLSEHLGSELAGLWGQNAQPVIGDVDGDGVDDVIAVYDSNYETGVMFTGGMADYSKLEMEQHGTFKTCVRHARH